MVPEPVRVYLHPALAAAADDHLVDALGGHRPAVADAQPQLRPPRLGVPGPGTDVPVQGPGALVADLDDALPAVLTADGDLPLLQIQVATLRIHRVIPDTRQLRQPDTGRLEHRHDRRVAALGERMSLAGAFQFREFDSDGICMRALTEPVALGVALRGFTLGGDGMRRSRRVSLLAALVVAILTVLGPAGSAAAARTDHPRPSPTGMFAARAAIAVKYPCPKSFGAVQITAAQWAGGLVNTGHDGSTLTVYSNYRAGRPPNPPSTDCAGDWEKGVDGTNQWGLKFQCTELAVRVADAEWAIGNWNAWKKVGWDGAAADMKVPGQRLGLTWTGNGSGSLPAPGDLMIWKRSSTSDPGHVAVVSAVTSTTVTFVGENQGYGMVTLPVHGTNVVNGTWKPNSSILGWLSHGPTSPGGGWTPTQAPHPPDWVVSLGGLTGLTCPSTTTCVAVGAYENSALVDRALVLTGSAASAASWTASALPAPANADWWVQPSTVTCASTTSCVAVGNYLDTSQHQEGLLLTWSGAIWTVKEAPLPANAAANPNVILSSLSCPSPGTCVAGGTYTDSSGNQQGLLLTWSGGSWTPAEVLLPANAAANPQVGMSSVSCPTNSGCVAVGGYTATSGLSQALLWWGLGRSWTKVRPPLPANGVTNRESGLESVHCLADAPCVVTGYYSDSSGTYGLEHGLLLTGSSSSWTAAEAPQPSNATSVMIQRVTCAAISACFAAGNYWDGSGHEGGLLLTGAGGSWQETVAPLPANSSLPTGSGFLSFTSLACVSSSSCVAVGEYADVSGGTDGLLITGSGTTWTAAEAPMPTGTLTPGDASLASVSCPAATCVAVGFYKDTSRYGQGVLVTGSPSQFRTAISS
jgi:hypothetical protein